ncbi:EthD family reductase [Caulobacter sp. SLTY]|uniref:EthD domain-containing protein n=1 Tax=Caulobacter sp. SLTY TaxID=2683262 RepID=UPI00141204A5|nr:EthD domain-containing protein [Caulobacter sp. SLTY]NBB14916.1 EthD family reductase [Caulobacter sp. SLTY]
MIKITFCLTRLPHLTRAEFQTYWREVHAPLVAERAELLRIRRYVQSHTLPDEAFAALAASRAGPPAYDGVAELWWDRMEDLANSDPAARTAGLELLEDEKRFIDLARSPIFLVQEHEIVAR